MLSRKILAALCFASASLPQQAAASPCDGTGQIPFTAPSDLPLTLQDTLLRVRSASPAVLASALETQARAAEAEQAGKWSNPVISLEVEDFAGSGGLSGFGGSEATLAIEQILRLGNKRELAQSAARARVALAAAECGVVLREASLAAALSYADLIAANEVAALSDEAASLGRDLAIISEKRVEAGEAAPPDFARAEADAARLRAEASGAAALVEETGYRLAAIWGGSEAVVAPSGRELLLISTREGVEAGDHPSLQKAQAAEALGRHLEVLESAQAIPDLTVSAGLKRFEATGDNALVAELSLPLPVFDRNRGAIAAARLRTRAASAEAMGVRARLRARKLGSIARFKAAEERLSLLQSEALPAAERAYEAALQGYRIGRFDLDQTINARAALVQTRLDLIAAEHERNRAMLTLRSLIGAAPFAGGQ